MYRLFAYFFFNDTATTEIYTLSLHVALPIWWQMGGGQWDVTGGQWDVSIGKWEVTCWRWAVGRSEEQHV